MIKRLSVVAFLASLMILVGAALPLPADPPATDPEALIQAGHWKRARAILEAQFQAHPQDPTNLYLLSQVKMALEDFDGALPLVQHAVELDGKNSNYHLKLGQVYGEMAARDS